MSDRFLSLHTKYSTLENDTERKKEYTSQYEIL